MWQSTHQALGSIPSTKDKQRTASYQDTQSLKSQQSLEVALGYAMENFKHCYNTKEPQLPSVGLTSFLCVRKSSVFA